MDFFGFSDVRIRILWLFFGLGCFWIFLDLDLGFSGFGCLEFLWIWILGFSGLWTWLLFLGLDRFFKNLDALDFYWIWISFVADTKM